MTEGLPCPSCGCRHSRVADVRHTISRTRRRRVCLECGNRFTTFEAYNDRTKTAPDLASSVSELVERVSDLIRVRTGTSRANQLVWTQCMDEALINAKAKRLSDVLAAEQIGVTAKQVADRRKVLGIAAIAKARGLVGEGV